MNTPEAGQFSIHQHMSTVSGSNNINNGNANARIADNIPNSSPSPSYSHIQNSSSFNEQEGQSAADHIVLYTIIRELCSIRMMLTGIYRLISLSTVEIDVDDIIPDIEHAQRHYESEAVEIQSSVLGAGIECEIRSLKHGLLLHKAISEYDIQKSSINLHLARVALSEWHHISSEQDYADKSYNRPEETSWRYNFFSSGEDKSKSSLAAKGKFNLQPNHLLWLNRWIASEKSKMTIYFMETLLEKEKAMGGDERSLWVNTEPDLHGIYPPDPPKDHWPNIISIMQGSENILRQFRSQYFYDRKIGCTYYVARLDQHVSVVIIYLDKHPQPDTGAMDFLQLLSSKLRHTEALTSMRVE
ncbi:hypothetical protein BGZ79_008547 [Entomortierella chlamydospora]|nr:hypothetical protein BGZ79_008547 [Entomortierella chlamydospora]